MTNESEASRNFVNSLFWSCTTCNLRFWENDRTSGIVQLLQFHRIEQRHCSVGARYKINWNHGSIWWTILIFRTILGFFSASTTIAQVQMPQEMDVVHTWPWTSRSHWNCQIVFPKPQQHWNQHTSLVHSPSIESCTWYSCTCKAWNKQAGWSSFCWPEHWVLFHSLSLLPLVILRKMY